MEITAFLAKGPIAVAGASTDRAKYGNQVLRALMRHGIKVYPINPRADQVEGLKSYPDLNSLPEAVHGLSIITPPPITEELVRSAVTLGIKHIWMQPGAESDTAIQTAEDADISVIHSGPCILVALAVS